MTVRTIDTDATIAEDRLLTLQLPPGVPAGRYRIIVLLEQPAPAVEVPAPVSSGESWRFPKIDAAQWPDNMPLRREEMYDDSGR